MMIEPMIERNIVTINENATIQEAVELMVKYYIGSLIVTGRMGFRGLFTERDLMMDVVGRGKLTTATRVADVLREDFVRVRPTDEAAYCLELMREHRCRHLLVFDDENFVGLVSIRDMVVLLLDEKEQLIHRLKEYIVT